MRCRCHRLNKAFPFGAALAAILLLEACASLGEPLPDQALDPSSRFKVMATAPVSTSRSPDGMALNVADTAVFHQEPLIVRGIGDRLSTRSGTPMQDNDTGDTVLNFENADVRDVVKSVLGDMLGLGYVVDPAVKGTITLRTAKPLSRPAVLPALEEALKLADVAVVEGTAGYQVIPLERAPQRGAISNAGSAFRPGYQIRIVPLRYISPADVQRVLEPLVAPGTIVQGNPGGHLVTLAGTEVEIVRAEQAIATFDVDWLRSQSFGLFPLKYTSAAEVADDLGNVIGKEGPFQGTVKIAPIAHLNSILVVSRDFAKISQMRTWIERFDRGRDASKPRLFVYHVQNGRAQDLAPVLTKVFSQSKEGAAGEGETAAAAAKGSFGAAAASPTAPDNAGASGLGAAQNVAGGGPFGSLSPNDTSAGSGGLRDLRITADEPNNSLLIVATPETYAMVEAALAQLDAVPMQVLLEASIAEIDLTDKLKYGVQTSFQKNGLSVLSSSVAAAALATSTGGLSASLVGKNIQATLDLLSTLTKVKVISAPKLVVLNNRTASIQVGDQVPVATSSSVSTISANAPTVNTIQMVDTGIILHVTPRVNRNGLVLMDLSQEVSSSVPTDSSSINSPTIQQRRVSTSVAVQDGQTIAIGGLIRDSRTHDRTGIPGLKDVPGIGALFSVTNENVDRTELIVLITPRVIRNSGEADAATDELGAELPLLFAERHRKP